MLQGSKSIPHHCTLFLADAEPMVSDLTGLEIALKGECEPLQVVLQPLALHIPGQILVETGVKSQFRVGIRRSDFVVIDLWIILCKSHGIALVSFTLVTDAESQHDKHCIPVGKPLHFEACHPSGATYWRTW